MLTKVLTKKSKSLTKISKRFGNYKIPEPKLPQFEEPLDSQCDINLSHNYPVLPILPTIIEGLRFATENNLNQYTRFQGYPPLVEQIERLLSPLYDREIDQMNEILVGTGGTGVIAGILWPFFTIGDGALVFSTIERKREIQLLQRGLKLQKSVINEDGSLNFKDIESKIDSNTKLIYFDNPASVNGRTLSHSDLEQLASIVRKHEDLFVISNDSLFANLSQPSSHHVFATFEGMKERTFTIYSTSGMFSTPGLRIAW